MTDILPGVNSPPKTVIAALALVALGATACGDTFTAGAATVNGVSISQDTLDERLKTANQGAAPGQAGGPDQQREVLFQLIQEELLSQEAAERKIASDPATIDERLNSIKGQFPSEAEFQTELTQRGFTMASLRKAIADSIVQEKLAEALGDPISDDDLRQVYTQERAQYEEVRARHILFAVQDQAQDAAALKKARDTLARIRAGASFTRLARQLSDDTGSKPKGGDLGYVSREGLVPEFAEAAFTARIGRPVGPVRSQFGYHLILVSAKRTKTFDQVKEELRTRLQQQVAQQAIGAFLQDALAKARIVVNPKFGDWDAETRQIVPHESFVPASPEPDVNVPSGFDFGGPQPGS